MWTVNKMIEMLNLIKELNDWDLEVVRETQLYLAKEVYEKAENLKQELQARKET